MLTRLLNLFGCRHSRLTFPQTHGGATHVSCLTCGASLPYSWEDMRIQPASVKRAAVRTMDRAKFVMEGEGK